MSAEHIFEASHKHLDQMIAMFLRTQRQHAKLVPRVFSNGITETDARIWFKSLLKPWNPFKRRWIFADVLAEDTAVRAYVLYLRAEQERSAMMWGGVVHSVWDIGVDDPWTGKVLLGHVVKKARQDGAIRETTTVWIGNEVSLSLFEGQGFAVQHRAMSLEMPSAYETSENA